MPASVSSAAIQSVDVPGGQRCDSCVDVWRASSGSRSTVALNLTEVGIRGEMVAVRFKIG